VIHQSRNKENNRKNRGEVSEMELNEFTKLSDNELIPLLKSPNPTERTCSAKILGIRKSKKAIDALCQALKVEKKLYSKIAISEALGHIGISALPQLIMLLGKIGDNQHKSLPDKAFEKQSYPLPLDIAARTITKMGENALDMIIQAIPNIEVECLSEAIDAIGFISYYSGNQTAFETIKMLIHQFHEHDLILWKLIRALQAFPNNESIEILESYKQTHSQKAIREEAKRSIYQIMNKQLNKKTNG
jgi:hypothetical protein